MTPPAPRKANRRPALPTRDPHLRLDFGPWDRGSGVAQPTPEGDPDLFAVANLLRTADPDGRKTAVALREAFDQIYDGRRTGRWDYSQLMKTEKTHLGTVVQIVLQRELGLEDGQRLDFSAAGIEFDCKWSRNLYQWEFPTEMYLTKSNEQQPSLALLIWANEQTERWASGLIRIGPEFLHGGQGNRDKKRKLNLAGCDRIHWLYRDAPMIPNTLVRHPDLAGSLLAAQSGQEAIARLFRELQQEIINQATIEAIAQQTDCAKRVRDARIALAPEGIVIFGPYHPHPAMAHDLGLPVPKSGSFVSARLHPWLGDDRAHTTIAGAEWRLAESNDDVRQAPLLPRQGAER